MQSLERALSSYRGRGDWGLSVVGGLCLLYMSVCCQCVVLFSCSIVDIDVGVLIVIFDRCLFVVLLIVVSIYVWLYVLLLLSCMSSLFVCVIVRISCCCHSMIVLLYVVDYC